MGLLNRDDATIFRKYFSEMCKLIGQSIGYQYVTKRDYTIHSEENFEYSQPIRLDVLFDENPTVDTLNRIGWVSEINNMKPIIINMPYNTPNLTVGARVMISSVDGVARPRLFRISKIASDIEYPDAYTCAAVPVFDQEVQKNQYTLVNSEKISEDASNRTPEEPNRIYPNYTSEINNVPKENTEYENEYEFIDYDNSPYSG